MVIEDISLLLPASSDPARAPEQVRVKVDATPGEVEIAGDRQRAVFEHHRACVGLFHGLVGLVRSDSSSGWGRYTIMAGEKTVFPTFFLERNVSQSHVLMTRIWFVRLGGSN